MDDSWLRNDYFQAMNHPFGWQSWLEPAGTARACWPEPAGASWSRPAGWPEQARASRYKTISNDIQRYPVPPHFKKTCNVANFLQIAKSVRGGAKNLKCKFFERNANFLQFFNLKSFFNFLQKVCVQFYTLKTFCVGSAELYSNF